MRFSTRIALSALLALLCLTAPLFGQAPPKQPVAKTPHGSVSGRVTIKDKPAPGVTVGLRKGDFSNPFEQFVKTVTDADGVYRITNVAPGSYMVMPSAPGFVGADPMGRKDVILGEDENVEGINFSLVRGGVITGKVTDADGHPVVLQQVELFRAQAIDNQNAQYPAPAEFTAQTDDRGIYRIFGISAGQYKVATGRGDAGFSGYSPSAANYKQVFHPDVTEVAKATVIEVTEGSEAKDVDITVGRRVPTFSVSGRVINSDSGLAMTNIRFGLQRLVGKRTEFVTTTVATNTRGEFLVEGLIPGQYGVTIFANDRIELKPDAIAFEIIDQDLTDATIRFSQGSSISGVVAFETQDKAVLSQLTQLVLRCFIPTLSGSGNSSSSAITADGGFRLAGLGSGPINFSLGGVNNPYPPKGFVITRIERDGVVVPRLELKEGEQITGVKIIIGYGTATLRGVIKVENGELPAGVRIFLRLSKPGESTSYIRPPQVDERGHFYLEGIPGGDYELTAYFGGGVRRPPQPVKQFITLTNGAVLDMTFTIDFRTLITPVPPGPPLQTLPPRPQ